MRTLKKLLDKSLETGLWIAMLAMTLTVIWQVFTRFVLRDPSSWTEELAIFLLIWIGLLGSAVALHRGAHLGIDIVVARMSERWARLTAIFVFCCVIFFAMSVFFFGGIKMVAVVLMTNQISPALGIRMGYVYLALPISGFFITMYAVEFIIDEIKLLSGRTVERMPETGRMDVPIE
ncbi:MAG: TRAP transporter small permease [Candidatus Glassbacteria bacterium]|nr:TRAP transporter small permease [Candidatus Glassbacteria bacterium]